MNIFSDTLAHLQSSLDGLVRDLKEDGVGEFRYTQQFIVDNGYDEECLDLYTSKGVYPYGYFTDMNRFAETSLPPRSAYYNDLTEETLPQADYTTAQRVWDKFRLQTLGDLCHLYVKSDVLLLSDVFSKYRSEALSNYGLDPLHYFTAPCN